MRGGQFLRGCFLRLPSLRSGLNRSKQDRVRPISIALVIALISLAYLEEDGLLLSIALMASVIVLAVELVAVRETVLGAKWIYGLR